MKNEFLIYLTFFFTLMVIRPASSQTIEMSMMPDSISSFGFDFTKALISGQDQSLLSGNFNFQYKHVLNNKINLIGEFNLIYFKQHGLDSKTGISNFFAGIQYKTSKKENIKSSLNVGVYLPTASEEVQAGIFLSLFDLPKFLYKTTSFHLGYSSFIHYNSGLRLGFELGSDLTIPIGDNNGDTELFGKYAFSVLYKSTSGLYLQTELLGIANITTDGEGFDESTFHSYSIGIGYSGNKVGAGLYYRNYFDDIFSDNFNGILGIEFNVFL